MDALDPSPPPPTHHRTRGRRGIRWALLCAFVFAVFPAVGIVFADFTWLATTERLLAEAAAAGAVEATLPRATRATIQRVVEYRLESAGMAEAARPVLVQRNGQVVLGACQARAGDRFAVGVAVGFQDARPRWLSRLHLGQQPMLLTGYAEHAVPETDGSRR